MSRLLLLVCLLPAAVQLALAQGVAAPTRPNRPQPIRRLYHNHRDGAFSNVTDKAGLRRIGFGGGGIRGG
ncbi:MAG TPA: hypothetical protein PLD20_07775 [Blastocatellia bacterium]|nr:hypothetical protein [Blastocatellia bacterium]HMZ17811.1 hypothetical protein [Blastocatellia bacterium]HNG30731.1 hypothetical protein [Blastocatellia bacterium]